MYKLKIDTTEFTLNGEWSIKDWMKLKKYDVTLEFNWSRLISEATGCSLEEASNIPFETQQVGVALIGSLLQPEWNPIKKTYKGCKLVEFEKMTIGTFVDCETAIGRGLDKWTHLLVSSLYETEMDSVLDWNIQDVYPAVYHYYNWRLELYKKYESLFDSKDDIEEGSKNRQDPAYAFYDMLMVLSDEKFLNIQQAADRSVYEALNFLAWTKDQAKKKELELKKQKLK